MKYNDDKYFYRRNFFVGLIFSLILVILLFALFPSRNNLIKKNNLEFSEPIIEIESIPPTYQSTMSLSKPINVPSISRMISIEEPMQLSDIEIQDNNTGKNEELIIADTKSNSNENNYEKTLINITPHQIIEVLPLNEENIKGTVKIRLLIDENGLVKKYEILKSTIDSKKIITNIIEALLKSKWQPITIEGEKVESWVEKTYIFN
ncbi:energy transducer TonB [Ignavibacteria bacterium 4148-Me]